MATSILTAVQLGWDPNRRDLIEGFTLAELRDIDEYQRYWTDGNVTDEVAHQYLIDAYYEAQAYVEGLPEGTTLMLP
jgi:hypothetical protein